MKVDHFNIRIVNTGDRYGLNDCLINDREPMIEFWDARYDHVPGRGQFVTRYFVSTILDGLDNASYPLGLCLDFGVPSWTVSPNGMRQIVDYLRSMTDPGQTVGDFIDDAIDAAVAVIQDELGQTDGGFAAHHLAGDDYQTLRTILKRYADAERNHLQEA